MNDTYSRREGNVISLGTDKLAMELTLTPEGRFVQTSLCHRVTGKEYPSEKSRECALPGNGKKYQRKNPSDRRR